MDRQEDEDRNQEGMMSKQRVYLVKHRAQLALVYDNGVYTSLEKAADAITTLSGIKNPQLKNISDIVNCWHVRMLNGEHTGWYVYEFALDEIPED
jgi:hypothetical protein